MNDLQTLLNTFIIDPENDYNNLSLAKYTEFSILSYIIKLNIPSMKFKVWLMPNFSKSCIKTSNKSYLIQQYCIGRQEGAIEARSQPNFCIWVSAEFLDLNFT